MITFYTEIAAITLLSVIICRLLMPQMVKYSVALRLVDVPNDRKLHKKPIPAIGGLVMMITMIIIAFCSAAMGQLIKENIALSICLLTLLVLGLIDDRFDLSAKLRFFIQIVCALVFAKYGARITNLHNIFKIHELPVFVQYTVTVIIIVGVTNAFNLIDGIDGLAGSIAMVNILLLSLLCIFIDAAQWLWLLIPLAGSLAVFLKYNWRPAKLFLGNGGSMFLGFLMVAISVFLIEKCEHANVSISFSRYYFVIISACFIIPVTDTFRVIYQRIKTGRSPFSPDKNHLHHLFIRQSLVHSQAALRITGFHIFITFLSVISVRFLPISFVITGQLLLVTLYTAFIRFSILFARWYRFIKKYETA